MPSRSCVVHVLVSHPVGPSCSFELSSTSSECVCRSLCVLMEVGQLCMLDARIAVFRSLNSGLGVLFNCINIQLPDLMSWVGSKMLCASFV